METHDPKEKDQMPYSAEKDFKETTDNTDWQKKEWDATYNHNPNKQTDLENNFNEEDETEKF